MRILPLSLAVLSCVALWPVAASAQTTTLQVFEISGSEWVDANVTGSIYNSYENYQGSPFGFQILIPTPGITQIDASGVSFTSQIAPWDFNTVMTVNFGARATGLRYTPQITDWLAWVEFDVVDIDPGDGGLQHFYGYTHDDTYKITSDRDLVYLTDSSGSVVWETLVTASAPGAHGTFHVGTGAFSPSPLVQVGAEWVPAAIGTSIRIEAVRFGIETTVIPEPSSLLLAGGLGALGMLRRRRQR